MSYANEKSAYTVDYCAFALTRIDLLIHRNALFEILLYVTT